MIKTRYGSKVVLESANLEAGCCVFRYPDGAAHLGWLADLRVDGGSVELSHTVHELPKPSCKNCSDEDCPYKEEK
jgi:hypothetical protein